MFTGLIQDIGTVKSIDFKNGQRANTRITIETALDLSKTPTGASICCSGVCLTAVQTGAGWFAVDISGETLGRSGIGLWKTGARINLEPSLKLGDELGGHFVFGHVDGQAMLDKIDQAGASRILTITVPNGLAGFIAEKGSVALDGVSLTVNSVKGNSFSVNIIPHTWENTAFSALHPGDRLNLEIDMLARYVARALEQTNRRSAA